MRGGVSDVKPVGSLLAVSSPHAWGCFSLISTLPMVIRVFPTCVGVFPLVAELAATVASLPHMRGGVSLVSESHAVKKKSSPHAWGCFWARTLQQIRKSVFPTCVGVFLLTFLLLMLLILHLSQ